jgi:hypothetical protein
VEGFVSCEQRQIGAGKAVHWLGEPGASGGLQIRARSFTVTGAVEMVAARRLAGGGGACRFIRIRHGSQRRRRVKRRAVRRRLRRPRRPLTPHGRR